MINAKIVNMTVHDVRFPTTMWRIGGDSMHNCVDHSCTYVILHTNTKYKGYGIAATLGKGNELVVRTCELMLKHVVKRKTEEIYSNFASFWRQLTTDPELRWLGPENGVVHLATAAIVNALWDLWARIENKPLWKLLTDMTPEQLVSTVDFRYIRDVVTEEEAIQMLRRNEPNKKNWEQDLTVTGFPAYTADVGSWHFGNQQIRTVCKKFMKLEFTKFKTCMGRTIPKSNQRCELIRKMIGKMVLMVDANQFWEREQAVAAVKGIDHTQPACIEDPTSSDDVLGHSEVLKALAKLKHPVSVSSGEMCANRVMFKQFLKYDGVDFWNINVGRLGGVNETLAVYFMAKKYNIPVWGHGGGIGLCEMMQHLQMWYSICLNQSDSGVMEFASHQHGYFEDPILIRNAFYVLPSRPGFSTKLKDKCIARWRYPDGTRWKYLFETKFKKNLRERKK
ncbi:hypothetical protein PUN28_000273 [Cardiocondyla obscurior]|uniref:Mandelate racemase/muconate lactonizing enzyme C-terminal domain-containing protein n=1 Tax=Cardiocondyla obscurior TaxID=286306 RepID=A0AAW2GYK9_9HYME